MNDTISRQEAIDALMAWEEDSFWDEECLKHRGEPFWVSPSDVIERLPSVQSERKKGKWLPDNNNYYEERFICSVCGRSYKVDTCMGKPMWDFCPCGADMRGEQE